MVADAAKPDRYTGFFGTDTTDRWAVRVWNYFSNAQWLSHAPGNIRRFWQRLTWGWDETDIWALDITLAQFMTPRLKLLKLKKNGVPSWCFPDGAQYYKPCGNPNKEGWGIAEKTWADALDRMIQGFELLGGADYHQYEDTCVEKVQAAFDTLAKCHGSLWD
jgi:hypothetical protein